MRSNNGGGDDDDDDFEAALLEVRITELQLYTNDLFLVVLAYGSRQPLPDHIRACFPGFDWEMDRSDADAHDWTD